MTKDSANWRTILCRNQKRWGPIRIPSRGCDRLSAAEFSITISFLFYNGSARSIIVATPEGGSVDSPRSQSFSSFASNQWRSRFAANFFVLLFSYTITRTFLYRKMDFYEGIKTDFFCPLFFFAFRCKSDPAPLVRVWRRESNSSRITHPYNRLMRLRLKTEPNAS